MSQEENNEIEIEKSTLLKDILKGGISGFIQGSLAVMLAYFTSRYMNLRSLTK